MRTRDAATSIFHSATARDARTRVSTIDEAKIRDAVQRSLRRARKRDSDEEHPGSHFVKAGVDFFHGDHPQTCGAAELSYTGPSLSMADAGNVMTGLGYEMTGRTAVGAEYEHDDHDGKINLVAKAPSGAKDRRARDDSSGSSGPGTSVDDPTSSGSSGSAGDNSPGTLGGMSSSASPDSGDAGQGTSTNQGFSGGSQETPPNGMNG